MLTSLARAGCLMSRRPAVPTVQPPVLCEFITVLLLSIVPQ